IHNEAELPVVNIAANEEEAPEEEAPAEAATEEAAE
ncbi:MAG: 50S ribosomal protein L25, partial [Actinomyces graevenitzii]|nr:50S ribosomal protein L25 [Actinomyces graevenitzii]